MVEGDAHYDLVKSIKMKDPFRGRGKMFGRTDVREDSTVKLTPGGRFLFVIHTDSCDDDEEREALQLYDLEKGGKCVWTFTPCGLIRSFDFEMLPSDCLRVAVEYVSWRDVES